MRSHLYSQLQNFNARIENRYREGWGSAVLFMPGSHEVMGESMDEVAVVTQIEQYVDRKYSGTAALGWQKRHTLRPSER